MILSQAWVCFTDHQCLTGGAHRKWRLIRQSNAQRSADRSRGGLWSDLLTI